MIYKRIIEVADILNGFAFKSKKYVSDGIRIMRIANVQDGYISDENPCFYPMSSMEEISNYLLLQGDLLVSLTGNVGRVGILSSSMLPAALNQRVSCIRPHSDKLNTQYLYYYLLRRKFIQDCTNASKGVAQLNLSTRWLEKYEIPVPSLDEQQRIVSCIEELFSSLDNAVETLQKTKEQLEVYRQAVLKEAFNYSEVTDIVELQSIVDDIRIGPFGTMLHKSDYIDGGIPVINPQHIKSQEIHPSTHVSISEGKANELSSYKLRINDVIMGRRGEMGRTAAVTTIEAGWICGTGSIIVRLKPEYDAVFYSQMLSSPDTVHYLKEKSTGTTMNNLNEDIVKHIPIPNITTKKQKKIKEALDAKTSVCDNIEQTVNTALAQAEAMRQSILKEAFEGKLS